MPAPSRPESATMSATATQQQQPLNGKSGLGRRGLRVMRPKTSATKDMPRDAPAPARVTAWFTSTVYDLSLSTNHLVPIMERNNAAAPAAPVMAGEWAANMPPAAAMAAEPQANPPAADMPGHRAAMMMLMDGRMAAGRAAKGNDVNKNDMGRTQYKHGAPPRAPPPAYKQQPMSRAQRTQQRSRTARSAMAASRS